MSRNRSILIENISEMLGPILTHQAKARKIKIKATNIKEIFACTWCEQALIGERKNILQRNIGSNVFM